MKDWREYGESPLPTQLRAALQVFARHGYHGASIRNIAETAGLSVPGLYHHHQSKQGILAAVCAQAMGELIDHTRAADADSDGTAEGRFDNVTESMIRFHLHRRAEAFVASTEIRSMSDEVRRVHVQQRDELQNLIQDAIEQGVQEGTAVCSHPVDAARAVSTLCVGIATWYRPDGTLDPETIVARQLGFARAIAGF